MQYRSDRLAQELRNEVSYIISRELKDPRMGFATITTVKVTPDLKYARILVSVLGTPEKQKATMVALKKGAGFVRRQLSSRLKLRQCPELKFEYDDSIEYGAKMDEILNEVGRELLESSTETEVETSDEESASK
jgi:ribosome-binding factor A